MYLHLRPASEPPICISASSGGPYEWGVCAVGIVAVGIAPRVDKVVGGSVCKNHCRFGFEVTFRGEGVR